MADAGKGKGINLDDEASEPARQFSAVSALSDDSEFKVPVIERQRMQDPPEYQKQSAKSMVAGASRSSTVAAARTQQPGAYRDTFLQRGIDRMTGNGGESGTRNDKEELRAVIETVGNGSFLRGWRLSFDPRGDLEVDYDDFCRIAGSMRFVGDVQAILGTEGDLDHLTLQEIAPQESRLLQRFMRWIKDKFGAPQELIATLDTSKKGKVARETFTAGCVNHGFQATQEEMDSIFDCCDAGDVGSILKEDVIFLEFDPVTRQKELFKQKGGMMRDWKQQAALDFLHNARNVNSAGDSGDALPPKHRLAPRPWQANAFEHIPLVVCQRRRDRDREARFRQKLSRAIFLRQLRSIYGNEVRAVRKAVSGQDGSTISLHDLRRYCRKVDLPVHIHDLWVGLDVDSDGKIGLEEIVPKRAIALARFQVWAFQRLGSVSAIWSCEEAVFARAKRRGQGNWISDKKMMLATFAEALDKLGWPSVRNAEERSLVFTSLDSMGCSLITPEDLEWLDRWDAPEFLSAEPNPEAWVALKELLVKTYGHPLRAWRKALDRDNSNRIAWVEFRDTCRKIRFHGDVGGAWRALDMDLSGYITMREYDPPSEELLSSFKEWAEVNFGSVKLCFKVLDSDRSGSVTFPELKRACHKMKWLGNVRTLFDCIDLDNDRRNRDAVTGKRAISLDELVFLDTWQVEPSPEVASLEDSVADAEAKRVLATNASSSQAAHRHRRRNEDGASDPRSTSKGFGSPPPSRGGARGGKLARTLTEGTGEKPEGKSPKLPHCEDQRSKAKGSLSRCQTAPVGFGSLLRGGKLQLPDT